MLRLFVPRVEMVGPTMRITGTELRHLRSRRLATGARFVVFDESGVEHEVQLARVVGRVAEAIVLATRRPARDSALDLVLGVALLKGVKMDLVVEKTTELGVRRLVPIRSRHTIAQGDRVERWRRIAVAAAKQSGRTQTPAIDPPTALADFAEAAGSGLRLVFWEGEQETALTALPAHATAVTALVGPEGGFSDDEIAMLRARQFVPVTLAPRILRAETAAIAAAALCQHRWGDLSTTAAVR
jgi:16S rRNA (uracil1498-N3)-methyltransferase